MEAQTFNWVEEPNELMMPSAGRKRRRPKRKEFVGWGSRQLIDFLHSIGKSTEEKLSQNDVTSIINDYINDNSLINPAKKKRVVCDSRLQLIFGKKTIARNSISKLLESHYAENESDNDSELYSSDERDEDKRADQTPKKELTSDEIAHKKTKACVPPPNVPAAIVPENIKAVYLRRTLVEELLKDPGTFESKVLGSYVRVKKDRYDYKQKNSHVLQLVTGIIKDAADGDNVRLEIAEMGNRVNISELSDVDFYEVECQDLHRRMIEDYLKQPTVAELQEKVHVLHEDITKHWLPRELSRLECRMDQANEKGWRGEYFACRDKRKLLQTPAELSRLLEKVPQVTAEKPKVEPVPESTEDCSKKASDSPTVIDWVISNDQPANGGAKTSGGADLKAQEPEPPKVEAETIIKLEPPRVNGECADNKSMFEAVTNGNILSFDLNEMNIGVGSSPKQAEVIDLNQSFDLKEMNSKVGSSEKQAVVIDLSDDEDDKIPSGPQLHIPDWHYMDPQGSVQGPFSLTSLKRWSDLKYFPPGFAVWKSGQSREQEVLLSELLCQMFPH